MMLQNTQRTDLKCTTMRFESRNRHLKMRSGKMYGRKGKMSV